MIFTEDIMNYVIYVLLTLIFMACTIFTDIKFQILNKKVLYLPALIIIGITNYLMIFFKNMDLLFVIIQVIIQLLLFILSLWDIKDMEIPLIFIYLFAFVCAVMMLLNPYCNLLNNVILGMVIAILLLLFYKFKKSGIGFGDIEIIIALAFAYGYPHIFNVLFVALFMSMFYGISLLVLKKAKIKSEIPFIPFLFLSVSLNIINF